MTTQDLVLYYANLLIIQYIGRARAYATIEAQVTPILLPQTTVQVLTFSGAAASGAFVLSYDGVSSASINWNDSASTIQTKLRAITGLSSITVTGSISSKSVTVSFLGVQPVALALVVGTNTLQTAGSAAVSISVSETDLTLPLAVQGAFNVTGSSPAVGVNLDVIGKYAGVVRTGFDLSGEPVSLNDAEFLQLIQMAIITNNAGSSLETIQALLSQFFPGSVLVFDYTTMRISYLISSSSVDSALVGLFINERLLPKPMGVQMSVVYTPVITSFFGFRTYDAAPLNAKPFNTYDSYNLTWSWLTYSDGIYG